MIPPKRSKDGTAGTANSRECLITKTYNQYLKAVRGWRHFNCGLDDWTFIPPSLLPTDPKQVKTAKASILKNGIHGVHYASGWMGLADMIDLYGRDYAPSLDDAIAQGIVPPTDAVAMAVTPSAAPSNHQSSLRVNRVSLSPAAQQDSDDGDDEETVAFSQEQTSTIEPHGEEREQDQSVTASTNEDDSTNHENGDDDDDDDSQDANNRKIAELMTCIEKCNSQITWINDNPNEQSLQEAQEQKQDLRNTKRAAHEQLRDLTSNNQEYVFL